MLRTLLLTAVLMLCGIGGEGKATPRPEPPKYMFVYGQMYTVTWESKPFKAPNADDAAGNDELSGLTSCQNHTIRVVLDDDVAGTVMHEVMHALTYCSMEAIGYQKFSRLHATIYLTSGGLARWMKENKEWVRFIQNYKPGTIKNETPMEVVHQPWQLENLRELLKNFQTRVGEPRMP